LSVIVSENRTCLIKLATKVLNDLFDGVATQIRWFRV